jgi:hypothetical protein
MKRPKTYAFLAASLLGSSQGAILTFNDDFSGPLDEGWRQQSFEGGHLGISDGKYGLTANQGGGNNPKISRSTAGELDSSYVNSVSVVFNEFGFGGDNTQSDFKWKSFGSEGFMEVVLNSFGDMRLYHNDSDGGGGNIQPNTRISVANGDLLTLSNAYNTASDTIDLTYSVNGGDPISFYSGGGVDGPIGDTITNFVEVEVFKWGASEFKPNIGIDDWSLKTSGDAVPEPSGIALVSLAGLFLLRRRK